LALKEIGYVDYSWFGSECSLYKPNGKHTFYMNGVGDETYISAPLKQQAFRWFRNNHQLFYTIETNCSQLSSEWGFDYTIYDKEKDKWLSTEPQNCPPGETTYKTYEEAETGCIDKLIEIVKNKL
jgi:hypothetical protein